MEKQKLSFLDLGRLDYKAAWDYQETLLQENLRRKASLASRPMGDDQTECDDAPDSFPDPTVNHLLFVEHPPVYTLGKSGKMENVLIGEEERTEKGIAFFQTNRGGDITFHGPGQLVGYPILDLEKFYTDIGRYLRELEEVVILTLAGFGITAGRSPGETGVWLDAQCKGRERKICAMGVRCSRWITMHGFALNVDTDLTYFNHIIPCGIQHKKVTSMKEELGGAVSMEAVKNSLKRNFENVFQVDILDAVPPFIQADTLISSSPL